MQGNGVQEAAMIYQTYLLHYRLIRESFVNVITVGTGLVLGYLILWARP